MADNGIILLEVSQGTTKVQLVKYECPPMDTFYSVKSSNDLGEVSHGTLIYKEALSVYCVCANILSTGN